jgi:uncharacterized protein YfeS
MPRYECKDDQSNKFWEVTLIENDLHLTWGAIGTSGRSQTKSFADAARATLEMNKLVAAKIGKGYVDVGNAAPVPERYYDNVDEGLARQTSHPNFVKLAIEDFYYDCGDDFSPFGSDDGSDTLAALEDWYRDGGKDSKIMQFLKEFLADWEFGLPRNILREESAVVEKWLAKDDMHESYLRAECCARLATAFGQLKIAGVLVQECKEEAMAAIERLMWMNQRARIVYPNWTHADDELNKLVTMKSALKRAVT